MADEMFNVSLLISINRQVYLQHKIQVYQSIINTEYCMGCISSDTIRRQRYYNYTFLPTITADLKELYLSYMKILHWLKPKKFFEKQSDELKQAVFQYLSDIDGFNRQDYSLLAVDMVHKLHPVDYKTVKVTPKWLLEACLRQHKFIDELPLDKVEFQDCYENCLEFLYVLSKAKCEQIVVPNKKADIMWHSHMQDNEKYKVDTIEMFKKVLDHRDDYSPTQLADYQKSTSNLWNQYVGSRRPKPVNSKPKPESNNVSNCGGGCAGFGLGLALCATPATCGGHGHGHGGCSGHEACDGHAGHAECGEAGCGGAGCGGGGCGGGGCGGGGCG